MAQDESNRQNQLLQQEIDAHRRTDAALQQARQAVDVALVGVVEEATLPAGS